MSSVAINLILFNLFIFFSVKNKLLFWLETRAELQTPSGSIKPISDVGISI